MKICAAAISLIASRIMILRSRRLIRIANEQIERDYASLGIQMRNYHRIAVHADAAAGHFQQVGEQRV